jgi:2-haloacid dehalogenase
MRLSDFSLLSFDCYGTLINWETGILEAVSPLLVRLGPAGPTSDQLLAAFARHESALEAETPSAPYPEILGRVYQAIGREWGVEVSHDEARSFGASVPRWPSFADSIEALQYLKRHYRLAILSNVDRAGFAASNARLKVEFDYIFTAEDIGSYKPSLRNFYFMIRAVEQDGIRRSDVLHTAQSFFHDHVPANQVGLASAWINRRSGRDAGGATPMPSPLPHFDFQFDSLGEMVEAYRRETAAGLSGLGASGA